jgi:hypothetical protein
LAINYKERADPGARTPIGARGNFVFGRGSTYLKHFSINFLAISGDSKHFLFSFRKTPLKIDIGGRGVPHILFQPESYFFCELKPHATFQNPTITPSLRKVTRRREEREERREKPQ